jgi:thiamine biosynthesis protein ThiI
MTSVVIHYKELALKGKNRPWFIKILVRNVQSALAGLHVKSVRSSMGRLELEAGDDTPMDELRARLSRVFGIANFSIANHVPFGPQSEIHHPQFFDGLAAAVLAGLGDREAASFRVSATRSDKRLPYTSPVIEREVGGRIKEAKGWNVQLDDPEMTIRLEMLSHEAFYFFDKEAGAGGMPSGTGGRVACLLSGGLDSPVAAFRMMRRGCSVLFIHFHSYPILSRASQEKVREIAALLTRHQLRSRLVLVPFGELQQQVVLGAPPELRVVIYRRLMLRIAERIARRWRARALVTGDVIGQVASQTLENMTAIAEAATMEILRPLVGMDKDEIIAESKRIGTYPISIIPDQDCCTLFTPRHPATRARVPIVLQAESALPIEDMVAAATAASVMEDFEYPR